MRCGRVAALHCISATRQLGVFAASFTADGLACGLPFRRSRDAQIRPHVYTEQAQIATLEHWVKLLDGQERVRIELDDGSMIAGTVAVRPTIQTYRDEQEREGSNGQLRIDHLDASQEPQWIWMDRIVAVHPMPLGADPQVMP